MARLSSLAFVVLCGLAGVAEAGELHQGRGYKVDVPVGFRELDGDDAAISPAHTLDLAGGLAAPSALATTVFVLGETMEPDATLVVARVEVDAGALTGALARQRYLLDRLRLDGHRFEALVADGLVNVEAVEVDGHPGMAMVHPGVEGPLGPLEPCGGALVVDGGSFIVVVYLMVHRPAIVPHESTWAKIRGSVHVEPAGALVRGMLVYGGGGLLGLMLVVLLSRFVPRRRVAPAPAWGDGLRLAMSSEGWGARTPVTPTMQPMLSNPDAAKPDEQPREAAPEPVGAVEAPPSAVGAQSSPFPPQPAPIQPPRSGLKPTLTRARRQGA